MSASITICICTRNRAKSLGRALESLSRLERPADTVWNVLVIDNGSSDNTADVALTFRDRLDIELASEREAGIAHARNAALRIASGNILLFIDDDVTVPPGWLSAYAAGFARHPGAGFFGGPIIAKADGAPAKWIAALGEVMPGALSWLDPDVGECILARQPPPPCLPWGANMAIRKAALGGRGFDIRFNRSPDRPLDVGEETALFENLLESGVTGVWLPAVGLEHHIGADRCSLDYLRSFCVSIGRYEGRKEALQGKADPELVRRGIREKLRRRRRRYFFTGPWTPLVRRLSALRDAAILEGLLTEFIATLDKQPKDG